MARKKLLLVGWDAADWKLIHPLLDAGKMPGMARLVEGGISGNLTTLEPELSPMLWTSIATGKMAYHHGVLGFTEVDPHTGKVVPVSAATRTCRTVWEMLADHGLRSHVVSWFATQGERDLPGKMVSNMYCHLRGTKEGQDPATFPPPMPGTYWPPELAQELDTLRVSPHDVDPDEVIRLFVPDAPAVDQSKDRRLWKLAELLAETFSVHNAATHLMESDPEWDFMAVYYRAIDEISHLFMHYHPPRMEGVPQEDFERYRHVVDATYRLHDLFLQRLMQLAGPDTAVVLVSDHGYHSDHLRPTFTPHVPAGITVWHRQQGVLAAAGPGFKRDTLVHGARLLDITPSILHWFGLPVGDDMEGRVLREAFDAVQPMRTIPTWERPGGPAHARSALDRGEQQALIDQFVALGYIEELPDDPGEAAAETRRENDWNLARACLFAGRHEQALPLLQACLRAKPQRTDYAQTLARCQLQLGLVAEAQATLDGMLDRLGDALGARLLRATIALEQGRAAEALAQAEALRDAHPDHLPLQRLLARAFVRTRRHDDAERAARRVLAADPHDWGAFMVLARVALARGDADAAVQAALDAVGMEFGNPDGHYLLGAALMKQQRWAEAEHALRNCIRLAPRFARAHRLLSHVCEQLGQDDQAKAHRALASASLVQRREEAERRTADVRRAMAARGAAWAEEDRQREAEANRRAAEEAARPVISCVVVSGLPRSGTSLMMQMLRAGGVEPLTDGVRAPDDDNPEGYWEWEPVKQLPRDPHLIEQADGKAVKVISALLPSLPTRHRYKIVYMTRPLEQVVASQWKMLERSGRKPAAERDHLVELQRRHSQQLLKQLRERPGVELLEVSFPELVADPQAQVARLAAFLGEGFAAGPEVLACVKPRLFRNRSEEEAAQGS